MRDGSGVHEREYLEQQFWDIHGRHPFLRTPGGIVVVTVSMLAIAFVSLSIDDIEFL